MAQFFLREYFNYLNLENYMSIIFNDQFSIYNQIAMIQYFKQIYHIYFFYLIH
jgi:hypothetical protein